MTSPAPWIAFGATGAFTATAARWLHSALYEKAQMKSKHHLRKMTFCMETVHFQLYGTAWVSFSCPRRPVPVASAGVTVLCCTPRPTVVWYAVASITSS